MSKDSKDITVLTLTVYPVFILSKCNRNETYVHIQLTCLEEQFLHHTT